MASHGMSEPVPSSIKVIEVKQKAANYLKTQPDNMLKTSISTIPHAQLEIM